MASYKQVQARGTLPVGARVRVLQWAEGQVVVGYEKVVWSRALVALAKRRVAAISLGTVISDLASKVSRSGSAA